MRRLIDEIQLSKQRNAFRKRTKLIFQGLHIVFLLLFVQLPSYSQSIDSILNQSSDQSFFQAPNKVAELVYLQTNKGVFETGENLWFKAYILDGQSLVPSDVDKTLYLQLINENTGAICWQEKYEIKRFYVDGHVYLHDTLAEGKYLLAAYTAHSFFKDSSEFEVLREIVVWKEVKPYITFKQADPVDEPRQAVPYLEGKQIQFKLFPEGGYLVSGLDNRLAFKAVDTKGDPLDVEGILFENGDTLLTFQSTHVGMGSFDFIPDKNRKYQIQLNSPLSDSLWGLPEIEPSGILFHLAKRDSSFLYFKVRQPAGMDKKVLYLRAHQRGNVWLFQPIILREELEIRVPHQTFPQQGIAEFTLIDEFMTPVAERLVYVNSDKRLVIKSELSKEIYGLREKVILSLNVTDQYGQPVVAHLGVTVFDIDYQNLNDPKTIFTHCYLSSQLKGRIYDPGYYFDEKNENCEEALDLLLLTQGWRRYLFKEQSKNESSQRIINDGICGTMEATRWKKRAPKGPHLLTIFNSDNVRGLLESDSTGRFEISSPYLKFGQGGYLYFGPIHNEEYNYQILMESPFDSIDKVLGHKEIVYPVRGPRKAKEELPAQRFNPRPNVIELGDVTVIGEHKQQFRDKYLGHLDSLAKLQYGTGDYVCSWDGYLNCPLHGHIEERRLKPVEGEVYTQWIGFRWINESTRQYTFTARFKEEYHYPKFSQEELLRMNNLSSVKGYYLEREFYQPQYDTSDSLDMTPDYRNSLLWAPSVLTNEKGEATVEFFSSDIYTRFVGVIEGVTGDGLLGHQDFNLTVRKLKPFIWEK